MFGKNKQKQEEITRMREVAQRDTRFFAQIMGQKEMLDETVREIGENYQQMCTGMDQMKGNVQETSQMAADNAQLEAQLTALLTEYHEQEQRAHDMQVQVLEEFAQMQQDMTVLVDENKHYTAPSKYLSEFPTALKAQNEQNREGLAELQKCQKQMGVLALNAAIEAGHLGEAGKQFVEAAESIRVLTGEYEKQLQQVYGRLEHSDERIAELEEQVKRLLTLLRENNRSMAKLMNNCDENMQRAKEWSKTKPEVDFKSMGNQITVLKNADEEIVKSEERNRIQLEDMTGELAVQKQNQEELVQSMEEIYQHIKTRDADSKEVK